jgi:hypothetical protein
MKNLTPPEAVPHEFLQTLVDDEYEEIISAPAPTRRPTPPSQSITPPTIPTPQLQIKRPNLLIDIQAKLQKAHSPGFEHFARLYNLKEMAKTLIF